MREACVATVLILFLLVPGDAQRRAARDSLWFAPAPGSTDMGRLFEAPHEWPRARQAVDVFKFYHQHTMQPAPALVGSNQYDKLVALDAFRRVTRDWGMRIALEAGSVKEFYCTPDERGMRESIRSTLQGLDAVRKAGSAVTYLAMDEPFLAGQAPHCGGPALEPTADRLELYMTSVRRAHPEVRIGLIEAYPSFQPRDFARMLHLMRERKVLPAFVHVDADLNALRPGRDDFAEDITRIAASAALHRVAFGIIIWGHNGDSDALYAADARKLADAVSNALQRMPDHLVVQSWAESKTGLRISPRNLPEGGANTHTTLLHEFYRRFQPSAVPR